MIICTDGHSNSQEYNHFVQSGNGEICLNLLVWTGSMMISEKEQK